MLCANWSELVITFWEFNFPYYRDFKIWIACPLLHCALTKHGEPELAIQKVYWNPEWNSTTNPCIKAITFLTSRNGNTLSFTSLIGKTEGSRNRVLPKKLINYSQVYINRSIIRLVCKWSQWSDCMIWKKAMFKKYTWELQW